MNKQTKKSIAFFLVVLCGVSLLNCKSSKYAEPSLAEKESMARAEKRQAEFIKKRNEYVAEHGHGKHYSLKDGKVYE